MRLLHVMASAPDGGAEMTMLDSVLALASVDGLSQYIVTRPNNDWRLQKFSEAGIAYATTGLNPSLPTLSRYKLARVINRFRPDIIQYWKARAGRFTYSRYRSRSVAWHGGKARHNRLSGCDWHIGASASVMADLLHAGVPEDRCALIRPFSGGFQSPPLQRADLGVPDGAPLALVLSRLHSKKGLNTLVDAVKLVDGLYVLIAGDGPMRGALEAQLKAQRLEDRILLLGWRNDRSSLIDLADFIVSPSRIEPFGKSVIEAWSSGKAIIAADADGPSTLITPGKTGLIVRRGDDEALAAAMVHLIGSPEFTRSLGEAGRTAYDAEFGRDVFLREIMEVYERIHAKAGPF